MDAKHATVASQGTVDASVGANDASRLATKEVRPNMARLGDGRIGQAQTVGHDRLDRLVSETAGPCFGLVHVDRDLGREPETASNCLHQGAAGTAQAPQCGAQVGGATSLPSRNAVGDAYGLHGNVGAHPQC